MTVQLADLKARKLTLEQMSQESIIHENHLKEAALLIFIVKK